MAMARVVDRAMLPQPWRVAAKHSEGPQAVTLELVSGQGEDAIFAPGQFNMLYAFGVGEVPISVSGDCAQPGRVVHTVRDVGFVSAALARLVAGDTVGLRGPFGRPWPLESARSHDVLVVAGGLGIAPLRPLLYAIAAEREHFGRVSVICGARRPEDLLFLAQLRTWAHEARLELAVTVDIAEVDWHGHVGTVLPLLARAHYAPAETVAFVCGPEVMMRIVAGELRDRGVVGRHIHLSLERNMKCAVGLCGHCQWGGDLICRDGPVYDFAAIARRLSIREL